MSARVARSIEHKINMGNYESLTFKASAEDDLDDEGVLEDALDYLGSMLEEALAEEIRRAKRLASDESYIHEYNKPNRSR